MVNQDEDDVEVVYDVPFGNNNNNKQSKNNRGGGRSNTNSNNGGGGGGGGGVRSNNNNGGGGGGGGGSNGMIGNYVDFENVFDPFERDKDDVREFFDEDQSQEDTYDVEKPNMFNDPRKVCITIQLICVALRYCYCYCYCYCFIIVNDVFYFFLRFSNIVLSFIPFHSVPFHSYYYCIL
jgi:hypothetical protein